MDDKDLETMLQAMAAYHVGAFVAKLHRLGQEKSVIAHALFLLSQEAEKRRQEWL